MGLTCSKSNCATKKPFIVTTMQIFHPHKSFCNGKALPRKLWYSVYLCVCVCELLVFPFNGMQTNYMNRFHSNIGGKKIQLHMNGSWWTPKLCSLSICHARLPQSSIEAQLQTLKRIETWVLSTVLIEMNRIRKEANTSHKTWFAFQLA